MGDKYNFSSRLYGDSASKFLETDAMRDNHKVSRRGFIETAGVATSVSWPPVSSSSCRRQCEGQRKDSEYRHLGPAAGQEHLRICHEDEEW